MLLLLFLLSGTSGLIYQVVWFRKLALTFGVTSQALGVVLAAFMGGLAIGGYLGGRLAQRTPRPLRAYGLVEVAIGLLGLSVLPLLEVVQVVYVGAAGALAEQSVVLATVRFALAFAVLIPPTVAMGMTLPLLVRGAAFAYQARRPPVAPLYAANTAGAVVGVLLAGFLLIGLLGLSASAIIAAGLNIGGGVYVLSRLRHAAEQPSPETEANGASTLAPASHADASRARLRSVAMVVFALSGFTSLAYEVVWVRLFSVMAFGITYGFTMMLAVLLAGIALGSAAYSRWARRHTDSVQHLMWMHLLIGTFVAISPLWLVPLSAEGTAAAAAGLPVLGAIAARCVSCVGLLPGLLTVVLVTSLLFGAAFPAATRACAELEPRWAARLGAAYAANVLGAVAGSLLAGFWLLPVLGSHATVLLLAAVNVACATALAITSRRARLGAGMLALGLVTVATPAIGSASLDVYRRLLQGRFGPGSDVLFYDEGLESSVALGRLQGGERALLINGQSHGSTAGLTYFRILGHLGPLLHPNPRDVLVIGLGSGASAGVMSLYPETHIRAVELSEGVVAAAQYMADVNYRLLENPRVTVKVDDGRNQLLVGSRKFDLIEADVLLPRNAGASVIYSREYFELARRALKPGGMMVQWLGSPSEPREYSWTLRTFTSVFPYVTFWMNGDVAIGSNEPQAGLDMARFQRLLQDPTLGPALRDARLGSAEAVAALQVDPRQIRRQAGPLITDDRPALEYFLTLPILARLAEARSD